MISRLKGTLTQITDQFALVENGGLLYEVRLPSALADRLKDDNRVGGEIEFETIYYIEAGDRKSSHYPRLVGFTDPVDREFFSLFIQVPGMGVRKALKSLILPVSEVASREVLSLPMYPELTGAQQIVVTEAILGFYE